MTTLEEITRGRELKPINPIVDKFRQMVHNRFAIIGLVILGILVILALTATWIAPYDPYKMDLGSSLQSPSSEHWLGTDKLGRDILSRMIYGSRISLTIGFIVEGIALLLGVTLGSLAGYFGGVFGISSCALWMWSSLSRS